MGWNGSDTGKVKVEGQGEKPRPQPSILKRGAFAGALVVVFAAATLWLMLGKEEAPQKHSKAAAKPIAAVKPKTGGASAAVKPPSPANKPEKKAHDSVRANVAGPVPGETGESAPAEAVEPVAATNATASPTDAKPDEKKYKPLFKNGVEQLLDMVTPASPGTVVPPPPIVTDEQLKEELKRAIENVPKASEDDTEETIARKLAVEDKKDEFVRLHKDEGWSITEYLKALREKNNADAEFLGEAHKVDESVRADPNMTDEDCQKARKQLNEKLKERGLPEIGESEESEE